MRQGTGWRWRLAMVLRRFPRSGHWVQRAVRIVQPRFTVGVVGVVLDDSRERVLLVEHVFHPRKPWGLPGGWINRGENPAQTVEREFNEETGLRVRALRPLIVQLGTKWHRHLDMVYLCELEDGPQTIRLSGELLNYRWTPCRALPPLVDFHAEGIRMALDEEAEAAGVIHELRPKQGMGSPSASESAGSRDGD